MHIAVVGCTHGELDAVYDSVAKIEQTHGIKVELVLCCGDFQAMRGIHDLRSMACPDKYKSLCSFHHYHSGAKRAPVPTIFIGGNHEASEHLFQIRYGGWAAPDMYYLGYAGCVRFGGLRIAGISGIYKSHDYAKGRYECPPLSDSDMRSIYHQRSIDTFRLAQLSGTIDIMMSHDWPVNVTDYGDAARLVREKPHFRDDMSKGELGSPAGAHLLQTLKPSYYFAGHMHCRFAAVVPHDLKRKHATRFLALSKPVPGEHFLQIVEVNAPSDERVLRYDEQWLAVLRSTQAIAEFTRAHTHLPPRHGRRSFTPTDEELQWIRSRFPDTRINPDVEFLPDGSPELTAPQTVRLLQSLEITDPFVADDSETPLAARVSISTSSSSSSSSGRAGSSRHQQHHHQRPPNDSWRGRPKHVPITTRNPDEIPLDDVHDDGDEGPPIVSNPDEVPLD